MADYRIPVHIALDSEEEKEVLARIQSIQDKIKEAKSLADEVASLLANIRMSAVVGDVVWK